MIYFGNFTLLIATCIFCEIDIMEFRGSKTALSTNLEPLIFHEFVQFWQAEINPQKQFRASEKAKIAFLNFCIL